MKRIQVLTVLVWLACGSALALDPNPRQWAGAFAGVTLGQSKTYDYASGSNTTFTREDDTDFAYVAFGGYQFLKYFGLAGAYVDLGTSRYAGSTDGVPFTDELKVDGVHVMSLGFFPVAPKHSFFAFVGAYRWKQEVLYEESGQVYPYTDKGTSPTAGVGYNWYVLGQNLGIHVEYSRFFDVGDPNNSEHELDRDFASLGIVWTFR
jgi:hypothetical protein